MIGLAGCIIKNEQGKILLLHRDDGRYKQWEIPGGKIEKGEEPEAAAIREIKEELDIEVVIDTNIGEKEFTERDRQLHYIWYSAKSGQGQPKVNESQTFDEFGYFSLDEMRKMFDELSIGAQNYLGIIKE